MWDRKKDKRVVGNVKLSVSLTTTKESDRVTAALLLLMATKTGEKLFDLPRCVLGSSQSVPLVGKNMVWWSVETENGQTLVVPMHAHARI
jgi:hypothetical protein